MTDQATTTAPDEAHDASGQDEAAGDGGHGRAAASPTELPARGWKDVLVRTKAEVKEDRVPLLSAAIAFYALLAFVPGLIAIVSLYGLVADPADVQRQVGSWLRAAPSDVRNLVTDQLTNITTNAGTGTGFAVVLGIVVALWSASSGMAHLIEATNIAYDETETRSMVRRRGLALVLTLGAIVFMLTAVAVIAVLPAVLDRAGVGTAGKVGVGVLRWLLLPVGMMLALSVVYRYAPDRDAPKWSWVSVGAIVATVIWLAASAVFAVYTGNFGKYDKTYGSLGAIVVLMLWLFITALCVIFGAELNAELERQTARDTTEGPERPMGSRDAEAADTLGPTAEQMA